MLLAPSRLSLPICLALALMNSGCRDDATAPADTDGGTAGETGTAATGGETEGETDPSIDIDLEPAPGGMRRLLAHEYIASIEVLLGKAASRAATPPEDVVQGGFDAIGATELSISGEPVETYERSAHAVARAAIEDPEHMSGLVGCLPAGADDACYEEIATTLGRVAWRRPLEADEVQALVDVAKAGRAWDDNAAFMTGVRYLLVRLLQSPNFLYLIEVGEPDEATGLLKLTAHETASRLSFFLMGRTPPPELLDAAEAGALADADGIRSAAEALLAGPEAKVAVATFFDELFRLRFLAEAAKNAEAYPMWSPDVAELARLETLALIKDIVWDADADVRTLYSADYTFVNDVLAALYGMQPPGTGAAFTRVNWPANQKRAGYMSQASFLSVHASDLRNKPTKRGKFVQTFILCNEAQPPPDDVVTELPPLEPNQTLRERLALHMEEPACRSCHGFTDPIGFAFEQYDGIGAFRTEDNGQPIDASGDVAGIGEWQSAAELGAIVATHESTSGCMIENLVKGKLGHTPIIGEETMLEELDVAFADESYSLQALLVEMAASPLFIYVGDPK